MPSSFLQPLSLLGYLGMITIGIASAAFGPALPRLLEELGISLSAAGFLIGLFAAGRIAASALTGIAADRWGQRLVVLASAALLTISFFLFGLFPFWTWVLIITFFIGLGFGAVDTGLNIVVAGSDPEERASALNVLHAFFGIGALIGPMLVTGGILLFGWQGAFAAATVTAIVLTTGLFRLRHALSGEIQPVAFNKMGTMLQKPLLLAIASIGFIFFGVAWGITSWLNTFMETLFHSTPVQASLVLTLFAAGITAGRLVNSLVTARFGEVFSLILLSLGSFIFFVLTAFAGTATAAAVFFTLTGLFLGGLFPTGLSLLTRHFSGHPGTITGLYFTVSSLGVLIFPPLMGVAAEQGGIRVGFIILIPALALLIGAALVLRRREKLAL